jgi:hypothetical protein
MVGMNASEIIEALGDTAVVAADLGVSLQAASNWKLRGLPRSRLLDLLELARERKVPGISIDVLRGAAAPRHTAEQAA